MLTDVKNIFYPIIVCILSLLPGACNSSADLGNATEMKSSLLSLLETDTTEISYERRELIDSIPLKTIDDAKALYREINRLTYDMHSAGKDAEAIVILRHMLDILHSKNELTATDTRQLLNMSIRLGATFLDMGMTGVGLDYYMSALDYCRDEQFADMKAMLYNNIGIVYGECEYYDKSEEYFERALEINLRKNIHHEAFLNYANLAEVYALRNETDKALEASQRSLDFIDPNKYPAQLASMRLQQGTLYSRLGQNDVAMIRFNSGLNQYKELGDVPGIVNAYLHISESHLNAGQPDSALAYAEEALALSRGHDRGDDMTATLKTLAGIQGAKGNYRKATELLNEHVALSDSLHKAERRLRLTNFDGLGSDLLTTGQEPSGKLSGWNYALVAVLVLLLAGITFLYLRQRRKCRLGEEENMKLAIQHANMLGKVNRELTTMSLEKLKQQEGVAEACESLRQVLLEINPRETAKRDHIRSLTARLSQLCTSSADDEFKLFFERVHPDFYKVLAEKHPDLTARDMRLCAFLHLVMATKEIAALTYREVRSVESARNRLRKKLGLQLTDDLTAYLRSVIS